MWRLRSGFADLGKAVLKVGNDSTLKNCRKNRLEMRPPLFLLPRRLITVILSSTKKSHRD
jgi:hypothetical protein